MDEKRRMLRHMVATVAYRGGKAVRGAPTGFEAFRAGPTSRSAGEILAHVGDLFDWALSMASGNEAWRNAQPLAWDAEVDRFFKTLALFDSYVGSEQPLACSAERLFQGPVADSLAHVGQLTMLRRLAGSAVRGENYSRAEIVPGRVGREQSPPRREFD
jgi:hypothetical protein